jgi:hypothetical protein
MSRHFGVSLSAAKEILSHELGFRKYPQRWVPHLPDNAQRNHRGASVIEVIELLRGREAHDFDAIATDDESYFHYHYEPREVLAASREKAYLLFGLSSGFKKLWPPFALHLRR